jgi:lipopolysaccharide export system protein LptC
MRPSAQQLYPVLALIVLAGGTVWLDRATRDDAEGSRRSVRSTPDFTAEGTRLTSFDQTGALRYELDADKVTNYPASDITELEEPRLRYLGQGRELRVSAHTGTISKGGDEVFLAGEVKSERDGTGGSGAMSFASETLKIWPDEERAETSDPVVLKQGDTTARALGMKTDNLFGTLDLIGKASVHFPRNSRTQP